MKRYRFVPALDTLEPRLPLSAAAAAVDPTDPVDAPIPPPGELFPGLGNPLIIAPTPAPDPAAPVLV